MDNKGGIKIFRRSFFVSLCRKLSQGNPFVLCFRKLPVAKKIMDEGGVSRFSIGELLSHNAELFPGEPFCVVFQKTSGSEIDYG